MLFTSFPQKGSKLIIPDSILLGFSSLLLINFPSWQTGRLTFSTTSHIARSNISEIFNNSVDWKVNIYIVSFFQAFWFVYLICKFYDSQISSGMLEQNYKNTKFYALIFFHHSKFYLIQMHSFGKMTFGKWYLEIQMIIKTCLCFAF